MIAWMVYVMLVGALLSAAAYAAERTSRARKRPTRGIWAFALAASLALPLVMSSVTFEIPSVGNARSAPTVIPLRSLASGALAPAQWMSGMTSAETIALPRTDSFLLTAWACTSGALTAWLFLSCVLLAVRRSKWRATHLLGEHVYIAHGLGPAVVGFLNPSIVLPPWILDSSRATQTLVLAHERQHVAARDPQLLAAAILVLVIMPWNLPVWWQLRRLRHAIEVDCDGRVLTQGRDVVAYGECLLDVGTRLSNSAATVAAMSESRSLLEQRIRIMMSRPQSWRRASMLAPLALSVAFVAVAAQVSPPNTTDAASPSGVTPPAPNAPPPKWVKVDPGIYDRYVGHYKMPWSEFSVCKVWRDGSRLMTKLTGQPPIEIFPASPTQFFMDPRYRNAQIQFVSEGSTTATSLVLKQGGADIPGSRIDEITARQLADGLALRIQSNLPHPASEAALRQVLAELDADTPEFENVIPGLAQFMRAHVSRMRPARRVLGKLESVSFLSVGEDGWDVYRAKYQNATQENRILLDEDGKISGLFLLPPL